MKNAGKNAKVTKKPARQASSGNIGRLLARSQKMHKAVQKAKMALADAEDRLSRADHELRLAMGASRESADEAVIKEVKRIARRENVMVFIWHRSIILSAIVVTTARHGKPGFYKAYREQLYDNIRGEKELANIEVPGMYYDKHEIFDVLKAVREAIAKMDRSELEDGEVQP